MRKFKRKIDLNNTTESSKLFKCHQKESKRIHEHPTLHVSFPYPTKPAVYNPSESQWITNLSLIQSFSPADNHLVGYLQVTDSKNLQLKNGTNI